MPKETANKTKVSDALLSLQKLYNVEAYQELHWEGSFDEYVALVREHPGITRDRKSVV